MEVNLARNRCGMDVIDKTKPDSFGQKKRLPENVNKSCTLLEIVVLFVLCTFHSDVFLSYNLHLFLFVLKENLHLLLLFEKAKTVSASTLPSIKTIYSLSFFTFSVRCWYGAIQCGCILFVIVQHRHRSNKNIMEKCRRKIVKNKRSTFERVISDLARSLLKETVKNYWHSKNVF